MTQARVYIAQRLTFIMFRPEKSTVSCRLTRMLSVFSSPEVVGRFSNVVPGSADCHVACKCVLIKCKLIRLIDLGICVLQGN